MKLFIRLSRIPPCRIEYCRWFSNDGSGNWSSLTPMEQEKHLFQIKRRMGKFYSAGDYSRSFECATELKDKVARWMGNDNAMYASSLSNVALMQKHLGFIDDAMANYTEALHVYEDAVGKKNNSYARYSNLFCKTASPNLTSCHTFRWFKAHLRTLEYC